jgi:hypothetical protein
MIEITDEMIKAGEHEIAMATIWGKCEFANLGADLKAVYIAMRLKAIEQNDEDQLSLFYR